MQIALTSRALFRSLIVWVLVIFFIIGGIGNVFPPAAVQADYQRWSYPDWFHYVTGITEFVTSILIARETTRRIGAILGGLVMASALATLLINAEIAHAAAPAGILIALLICLQLEKRAQEARWEGKVF